MIPVKLSMRNFMCYRDDVPPLHFDGIHLACLSGDNGNGKSAIIDAITWALWGKARAGSDDDLIHGIQPEMEVEFDFMVGDQLYRILRKRSRPKRRGGVGKSSLEFQVNTGDGFRPITGNTMTLTQQGIIGILHMDYDTFVNSAYLRQGHADEFTRQASAKRKEVLGNILGLSRYDELEEQARDMARRQEAGRVQLEVSLRDIADAVARKPDYEIELEQAQNELSGIDAETKAQEGKRSGLRQKTEALEHRKTELDEIVARIGSNARNLERWEEQARQSHARIKEYEGLIGRSDEIEDGYRRFTAAKKTYEDLNRKSQQFYRLEKQKDQQERRITEAQHALTTEHTVLQRDIASLDEKVRKLPELRERLGQGQAQQQKLAEVEKALQLKESALHELRKQVNFSEAEQARLQREIGETDEKLDLIAAHRESQTGARCPLCETELTREGLELIADKYTREKQEKTGAMAANREELARKKTELEALQKEKAQAESDLGREKTKVQGLLSVLQKEIAGIEEDGQRLAGLRETIGAIEQRLMKKDFAATEQQALAMIEAELAAIDYDAAAHEQSRQQLEQLQPREAEKRKLDEAVMLIEREKASAARSEEDARGLRESMEADNRKREALAAEITRLPGLRDELARAETGYRELVERQGRAQERVGNVRARIEYCVELELQAKEKKEQLSRVVEEEAVYRDLARIFGKTGIQALLIEMAIPEIENEANRLLGRMTDNRMHVKFDTQRETKAGTIRETLDINIADELGTRNYEMFSGGEAFRINFAIRIALSRLLAKRAGAPLPTLIIDEGFGTQDSTGIEKLKEAIISIQEDFTRILVITHMDELRDSFPTRIDVTRTAAGSTVSVN